MLRSALLRLVLSAALVALLALPRAAAAADPFAVITQARRALEGDSVARVRARWEAVLRRAPADRDALLGLATLARITDDFAGAERLYLRLVAADPRREDAHGAYARLGRALTMQRQGRDDLALRQLDSVRVAAAAAARPDVLAWVVINNTLDRPAAARGPGFDSAAALARPGDVQLRAELHCYRGAGDRAASWERRLAAVDSGLALAPRSGLLGVQAACLQDKATVLLERGDVDGPIRLLLAADTLLARAKLHLWRASGLYRLGYRYLGAAQFGRAMAAFRAGAALADSIGSTPNAVRNHYGIIQTALVVNDVVTAEEHLAAARALLARVPEGASARFARTYEALIAQAVGDDARARRILESLLPAFLAEESPMNQREVLLGLAWVCGNLGDHAAALRYLAQAREVVRANRLDPALADLSEDEGRVALLRGDLPAAERLLRRALAGMDSSRHAPRYQVRVRLAEVHAARGDLAGAEAELRAAGEALDRWRATLEDQQLRMLVTEVRKHGGMEAGVPRVLAALAAGGRAEAAFELAERRRARELVTRMSEAEALREGKVGTTGAGGLRTRAARQGAALGARELMAALPDDRTALLEYVAGPGATPTTLFVVTRQGVHAARLPPADSLADGIARLVALLEAGGEPQGLARTLGAALLDSALARLGPAVTRLVVVPDGPLHRVPFDALRLRDGRWVVERFTVASAPSATVATALWRRAAPAAETGQPARLLALGDPAFADERAAATSREGGVFRAAFETTGGLARLTGSGREARLVARYAPEGEVRLRGEASEAFLKGAPLADVRVLHFATHALVDDRTVARTALALAPGAGEDGFVSPGDLASLPLAADLVVLSACRTAGGRILGGEGVWGLTAPLLQAGVRSVVATEWRVGDERTVRFVGDFYGALAAGQPVADALRSAKLAAIRRGAPPGEWAAFTVVGDPTVTIPLRVPPRVPRSALLLLLGLAGGAAVVALWWWRRRRSAAA